MADATDLKSVIHRVWGFESPPGYHFFKTVPSETMQNIFKGIFDYAGRISICI